MKFVDEAVIRVEAGDGGDGGLSFLRLKYMPNGGPDGGDGGDGGSIWLVGETGLNTLADFRVRRTYRAQRGVNGMGRQRTGRSGVDLTLPVPVGSMVSDHETGERIGDITAHGQRLLVARGGFHGLGNARFKSSVNRAPRRTTPGTPGDQRMLRLELKLLADVGLLGLPNAGKSSLIRALSAARPRVADYPFTTLHPGLGVVRIESDRSFVVADIPGIIEGAAEGAGLGLRFLRHLARNRLLLHLVDLAAPDPAQDVRTVEREMEKFSAKLDFTPTQRPRWLAFNKIDLFPAEEARARCAEIVAALGWRGPVFAFSALQRQGTRALSGAVMQFLERLGEEAAQAPVADSDASMEAAMEADVNAEEGADDRARPSPRRDDADAHGVERPA